MFHRTTYLLLVGLLLLAAACTNHTYRVIRREYHHKQQHGKRLQRRDERRGIIPLEPGYYQRPDFMWHNKLFKKPKLKPHALPKRPAYDHQKNKTPALQRANGAGDTSTSQDTDSTNLRPACDPRQPL